MAGFPSFSCLNTVPFVAASLVAQTVKNLPAMWETWVQALGWEDPLERRMATHASILAWRISWTEELDMTERLKKKKNSICCPVTNRLPDVSLPETVLFGIKKDCNLSLQPWWATGKSHRVREGDCFCREEKEVGFSKPRVHGFSLAEFLTGKERSLYCPRLCYQRRMWELPLWFPNSIWLTLLLIHFLYIEYIYATHTHIRGHKESDLVYDTHTHTHGLQRVRLSSWTTMTSICQTVLSIRVLMSWLLCLDYYKQCCNEYEGVEITVFEISFWQSLFKKQEEIIFKRYLDFAT